MQPNKIVAIAMYIGAIISTIMVIQWVVPIVGPLGYAIAAFDAIVMIGLGFYFWNRTSKI